jgi:hypothetical protein
MNEAASVDFFPTKTNKLEIALFSAIGVFPKQGVKPYRLLIIVFWFSLPSIS